MRTFFVFIATLLLVQPTFAQGERRHYDEETLRNVLIFNRVSEVERLVRLTPQQMQTYISCCETYYKAMYQAIYVERDREKSQQMSYNAKKILTDTFMNILTEPQRITYWRNYYAVEIQYRTQERVQLLKESGEYIEAELDKAYREINEYLMLEKMANMMNRYDIAKQRDHVGRVRKLEPQSLKAAKAQQKLKVLGLTNKRGY